VTKGFDSPPVQLTVWMEPPFQWVTEEFWRRALEGQIRLLLPRTNGRSGVLMSHERLPSPLDVADDGVQP
jgi:hypothetical protein